MKNELILGIYTPLQWLEMSKPDIKQHPYNYCWVCKKQWRADFQKWLWAKRKLIKTKTIKPPIDLL